MNSWWLQSGVAGSSTIGGQSYAWAQSIVWGQHVIGGRFIYYNARMWDDNIIWGTGLIRGNNIVPPSKGPCLFSKTRATPGSKNAMLRVLIPAVAGEDPWGRA